MRERDRVDGGMNLRVIVEVHEHLALGTPQGQVRPMIQGTFMVRPPKSSSTERTVGIEVPNMTKPEKR